MATLAATNLTLSDWAKRLDPGGSIPLIAEMLSQMNPILEDMVWKEGNLPTGHRVVQRTELPSVSARRINEAISPSKSTTVQSDESCAMLEALSTVDVDLAMLNGNTPAFRLSEAQAFVEAMQQTFAGYLFYGNAALNPERFTGFMPRYASLSGSTATNVLNGGGAGSDNASILLTVWGDNTVHGIYPKGSKAGLVHENLGEQLIQSSTGISTGMLKAFVDRWQWKCGLAVKDWRYVVRTANIDVSNLVAESSAADLVKSMIKMIHRIPSLSMGKPVFYVPRSVREMLDIQALNKATYGITIETFDGKPITMFRGIPVKTCDQMLETEAAVA